jgi:hypothetical protein
VTPSSEPLSPSSSSSEHSSSRTLQCLPPSQRLSLPGTVSLYCKKIKCLSNCIYSCNYYHRIIAPPDSWRNKRLFFVPQDTMVITVQMQSLFPSNPPPRGLKYRLDSVLKIVTA